MEMSSKVSLPELPRQEGLTGRPGLTRRALFGAPALLLAQKTAEPRPNVLFIASDDLRNALGCYGHPIAKTPNLDRLAAAGVRFDRAYCQFPLCGPSRVSILSGLRPDSTKIWANQIAIRKTVPDVVTLPQLCRQSGWHSSRFGKMYHMDVPQGVGTNNFDDEPSWDVAISPKGLEHKTPGEGRVLVPQNYPGGDANSWVSFQGDGSNQADHVAAELAIENISRRKDSPWFIGLGFLRPHVPYVAPARFFDLYPLRSMEPVRNPPDDVADIPKGSEIAIDSRANDMGMTTDAEKRETIRAYYASVSYMDHLAGKVLDQLERTNQTRRTVIVFWSDHGYHLGEHYRWHKKSLFEESARVPLIVSAPGNKSAGKSSRALVELIDLYPTVAELCRLPNPGHLEGQSMVPLLDRPGRGWKSAAFTQVAAPGGIVGRGVCTDRYRYIRWTGPHPDEELYDHKDDPREFTNLARGKPNDPGLARMRAVLDAGWEAARAKV